MKRHAVIPLALVLITCTLLLIPETESTSALQAIQQPRRKSFAWNQDAFWHALEKRFVEARRAGCEHIGSTADSLMSSAGKALDRIAGQRLQPGDSAFVKVEDYIFGIAPLVAACPDRFPAFAGMVAHSREVIKRQSEHFDMDSAETRVRLYRLLYGARAAAEEIQLQLPREFKVEALTGGTDEPSVTPWASILGVKIHSGDILVSRGGAPTSALIARGNDFPGNFSHVALVHVDPETHLARIIEAHIERGVTVSTMDDYLNDKKLRVMVLRLRSDLPALRADPMLPHRAAELALQSASRRHIPYDFAMDFQNSDKWFCSEVASFAYKSVGVRLWMGLSSISSTGLRSWLAAFGVRNFETQEPSDLEYDPQLSVVAEWRDPETLRKDHFDNAVTEAMLEGAEAGDRLTYTWYLLPAARILKAYSSLLNLFGKVGPIPEGMPAAAALRSKFYSGKHDAIKQELTLLAQDFERHNGYPPPYWELVQLARTGKHDVEAR
jgi:hypothetical protein